MKILQKIFGIVILAFLIAIPVNVFADDSYFGTGSNGLDPYGSGSNGLNPYGTGSNGLNPYGLGSNGLNPYGSGSNGLNPYGTGSNGLNPYGGTTTTGTTGSGPTTQPPTGPNPNPTPGPSGTTWASLSNQIIQEDSAVGTIVYPGLRNLCFSNNGVSMAVTTTSSNFDLVFRNDDLVLNRLTSNFNGAELVGLDCNGVANSFSLSVSPVNDAPTFTSTPVTSATRNVLYSYDANAADVEGNAITFALITSPAGMTIDSNSGLVRWTASQTGSFTVQVRATDSQGAAANQAYVITVSSGGSGGGSSGGSSGSGEKHNLEIASVDLDSNFVCGDNFRAVVSLVNTGKFSEAASVKIESEGLRISESKSTSVTKGSDKDIEFTFTIPEDAKGNYNLVTKLTYPDGSDFDYKTISVTCEEKKKIEPVITTSENEEKQKNLGVIVTLILAILAGSALLVWFVLLLKDEFMTTERFI